MIRIVRLLINRGIIVRGFSVRRLIDAVGLASQPWRVTRSC